MNVPVIRPATAVDIGFLGNVERSAALAFRVLADYTPGGGTVPTETLAAMEVARQLWVAADSDDRPVGFIGCKNMDSLLYIHEISVAHDRQKQGIGRRLMQEVIRYAEAGGYPAVGLTTRRNAVWNMPFYKTLGFVETGDSATWPGLIAQLRQEIANGASPAIRCAMVKRL